MTYADITIVTVSSDRRAVYLAFSRRMADVYREHGATRVVDYWQAGDPISQADFHADGLTHDEGELPNFAGVMGASDSESVVVTVVGWPSRDARDLGTAAATADPRVLATLDEDPVFDGRRVMATSFEIAMDLRGP